MQNPFQSADLRSLPWWREMKLCDDKNGVLGQLAQQLEESFRKAVDDGKLAPFRSEYSRVAGLMVEELPREPMLAAILDHAFSRLVTIYSYLRQRRTSPIRFLKGDASVVRWQLDKDLLAQAIDRADRMHRSGVSVEPFELRSSPNLQRWIFENYWPIVRKFSGLAALPITMAHIRCLSHDKDSDGYERRFQYHRFGNHHYDQDVYSLPLIIYLSDVSEDCGPFEYLGASDKYTNRYVLRAFHQALNHDCGVSSLDEVSFPVIAKLPSVFRGGDVVGNLYPEKEFKNADPVVVTGGIGTAVMFDGFHVIHSGGFPSRGLRKSLFINFRFPVAKIVPKTRLLLLTAGRSVLPSSARSPVLER